MTICHTGWFGPATRLSVSFHVSGGNLGLSWNADSAFSRAADIGKLYNGNSLLNYSPAPKGWSHIDVLVSIGP